MKKNKKVVVVIGSAVFCAVLAIFLKWYMTGNPFQPSTILTGMVTWIMALIGLGVGLIFFQKVFNRPVKQLKKIVLPAFILFLLIIFLIFIPIMSLGVYVFYLYNGWDTGGFFNHLFQIEIPWAIKMYSVAIFFAAIFFFYSIWRHAIDREQKLREENLKYQYRTLKTQVNPHFLFNSLNTLSELVYVDAKKADNYIQKLGGVYRYILNHEKTDLIPLNEEITFVKQYFDLQEERAENKVQLEIDIKNADKFRVIPVSLQILVENALKHNSMSEECPLKIQIYLIENDNEYVTVSNNIQRKSIIDHSSGTGLSNLKERVKLITGKEVIINQNNNIFTVKLPVLESLK